AYTVDVSCQTASGRARCPAGLTGTHRMSYGQPIATPRTAPPTRTTDGAAAGPDGAPAPRRAFRPDVDGLRAVAIVLVVAYHAHLPKVGGGFIGVDVFFVISGYLITRNLLAEADSTGRVALR